MKTLRKLWLSVVAVVFAVVALGTTTFAWFSASTTASVSNIDLNVQTAGGILISLDGTSWSTTVTGEEVLGKIAGNKVLNALTLTGNSTTPVWRAIKETDGSLDTAKDQLEKVVTFTIHIKSTDANNGQSVTLAADTNATEVTFDTAGVTLFTNASNTTDGATAIGSNTKFRVNPANALRIGVSSGAAIAANQTILEPVHAVTTSEPSTAAVTKTAILGTTKQTVANNLALNYFASVRKMTKNTSVEGTVDYTGVDASQENEVIANLSANATVQLTFALWIEGYDPSCVDAILAKQVSTALTFKATELGA